MYALKLFCQSPYALALFHRSADYANWRKLHESDLQDTQTRGLYLNPASVSRKHSDPIGGAIAGTISLRTGVKRAYNRGHDTPALQHQIPPASAQYPVSITVRRGCKRRRGWAEGEAKYSLHHERRPRRPCHELLRKYGQPDAEPGPHRKGRGPLRALLRREFDLQSQPRHDSDWQVQPSQWRAGVQPLRRLATDSPQVPPGCRLLHRHDRQVALGQRTDWVPSLDGAARAGPLFRPGVSHPRRAQGHLRLRVGCDHRPGDRFPEEPPEG